MDIKRTFPHYQVQSSSFFEFSLLSCIWISHKWQQKSNLDKYSSTIFSSFEKGLEKGRERTGQFPQETRKKEAYKPLCSSPSCRPAYLAEKFTEDIYFTSHLRIMVEGGRCKALRDDCTITVKRLYQKPMKKELSRRFGGDTEKKGSTEEITRRKQK